MAQQQTRLSFNGDLFGNDMADELAKKGTCMEQLPSCLSLQEAKTVIKAAVNSRWHEHHPEHNPNDAIRKLDRAEQVIIARLRCGHNRLNYHMKAKFNIGQTANCPCGALRQDAHHVLQVCPLLSVERDASWHKEEPLRVKLYGSIRSLLRTTAFIRATGPIV